MIAAFAALTMAAGCGKEAPVAEVGHDDHAEAGHGEEHKGDVTLTADAKKTADVRTATVTEGSIQARLEVPGSVSIPGNARAVVTPPVEGKVVRLFADLGDTVRCGQPLVEIQSGALAFASSSVASAETAAAQAAETVRQQASAVDLASGRLRTVQANLARQRQFASAGAFSQPTLVAARNELSQAQSELLSAQAEEEAHIVQLARVERLNREGLVSLNDLEMARLERRQDELRLSRARNRIALARQTYERELHIEKKGLANSREVGAAEAEVRAAKLEVDHAHVGLQGAKAAQTGAQRAIVNARSNAAALRGGGEGGGSTVTLTAPISGVVTERQATLGQAVERASDLFDIEDASTVWVTANVPEAEVSRIRPGVVVAVTTSAYPGRTFSGTVQLIGTRLDPKTRTLPVQCRVANPARILRADLFARVRIATGGSVTAVAVPPSAVVGEGDDQAVFVDEGGKFERRKVRTGRTDGRLVEIVEGLKVGDRIAISGVFTLQSELKKEELKGHED
ncbi:hypothetical protein BH11ARM2_BH11ARM2_18610 [soil metagenome]